MVIFLNPYCCYGQGLARWKLIESELAPDVGAFDLEIMSSAEELPSRVSTRMRSGETIFIAAGGDGTVNLLLNAIMQASEDRSRVCLGAIGLGSSNDFHKPFEARAYIGRVPVRIKTEDAPSCDVIRVDYRDDQNRPKTRYCLNNASIGVTAEANELFNHQPGFVKSIRKWSVNAAIVATALKTVLDYRNIACRLSADRRTCEDVVVTNLGIVKNPHFAGSLSYERLVLPDDGLLGVHLCERMSRMQAIMTLLRLSRGKFQGRPNTRTWRATQLSIESEHAFAVELDGETVRTRTAEFSVVHKALRCCQ